jgi:hypothetical protein
MKKIFQVGFLFSCITSFSQAGSEIYLFDIKVTDGQVVLSNGKNITNHKGYDNQPFFHPSKPIIYYSSFDDSSRSDIKYYDYEKKETKNLTLTHEKEYSPTVTPDRQFISCILQKDNGEQNLVKYPINGGKPIVMINHLKIGYHAWAGENKLLLFVLDDSVHNSLHYYYLEKNADTVIAENIGRSLHKIPGQNAMSFVQKISATVSIIKRFDMGNGVISTVTTAISGQDHLAWLQNGMLVMSDGAKLFVCYDKLESAWQPVIINGDATMLKGVTRLAANADNTKLAVVVSE